MRAVAMRPVASRTVAVCVWAPFGSSVVIQPSRTCTQAHVWVAIVLSSTASVDVFDPAAAPGLRA